MEKRVFLAIFLSFGILAVYQTYIVPPPAPVAPHRQDVEITAKSSHSTPKWTLTVMPARLLYCPSALRQGRRSDDHSDSHRAR